MTTHFPNLANTSDAATPTASPAVSPSSAANPSARPPTSQPPLQTSSSQQATPATASAWTYAQHILTPDDMDLENGFDFIGLTRAVNEHLMNHMGSVSRRTAPRMLWIQGKPGEGKTTGAKRACLKAGFDVAVISAGTFAGDVEGAPVKILNDLLAELERWSHAHRAPVVLLLDDFDNSTANVGKDTSSTINSQLLTNEMMALADKRNLYVNVNGGAIPFILSCNDATGLRESLTRTGRALWHTHTPSDEDKANFAWFVLAPKSSAERELVEALFRRNRKQSIAFWEAMPLKMRAIHAETLLERGLPSQRSVDAHFNQPLPLTPEIAWEAAKRLRENRVRNFLARRWRRR